MSKQIKGKKLNPYHLKSQIVQLLKKKKTKSYTARQILKKLKINNTKGEVINQLTGLEKKGLVSKSNDQRYRWNHGSTTKGQKAFRKITGTLDVIKSGAAYLISPQTTDDVYIPQKRLKTALNGDEVEVEVFRSPGRRRKEGAVIRVINRSNSKFVAKLIKEGSRQIAQLGHEARHLEVQLDEIALSETKSGTPIIIEITDWNAGKSGLLTGRLIYILDANNSNETAMQSILLQKGFDIEFPPEVIAASEQLTEKITEQELTIRRDLRDVLTFTIDPEDAKDFDDAISYRALEDGQLEIGVHIADVSHFVRPGTALDREAYHRSTSVYLVDRVCPMLPERLSNGLCSLRPHEDKYTFSAIFNVDNKGKIIKRWFGKTVIHSDRRFSYEEAQEIIQSGKGLFGDVLTKINALTKKWQKQRYKNGSIAFETEEVKFRLDENAVPIEAYTKVRQDAHLMIEDLMLLANREVAHYMAKKENGSIPFVYRVHDTPDPDRVSELATFAIEFGIQLDTSTPQTLAKSFNDLVKKAENDQSLKLLIPLAIRTMAKAIYTTENIGHYGLAFDYYTHFTSPIRRYADVLVHRILFNNLKGSKRVNQKDLEQQCEHISAQERKAMEAERASIKYKQVEYMSQHIGESFDGIISGMIDMGLFVEMLPSYSEGMVRFERFSESFSLQDDRFKAVSSSGTVYHTGQRVQVRVISTDLALRQIELEIIQADAD